MLPFVFADPRAMLGIKPWGLCVVVAAWVGAHFAFRRAREHGYDLNKFRAVAIWAVVTGFVLGHVLDLVFYHPEVLVQHPVELLFVWKEQSSTGGFVGAVAGGLAWKYLDVRRRGLGVAVSVRPVPLPLMPFTEVITATFPITEAIGRLGCALVHDHPGRLAPAGSPFALAWPTGPEDGVHHVFGPLHVVFGSTSRYDLGLLELALVTVLALALASTWKRRMPMGFYTATVCLTYAPIRFGLDFLRMTGAADADRRWAGLTFAQWFCVGLFTCGLVVVRGMRAKRLEPAEEAMAPLMAAAAA